LRCEQFSALIHGLEGSFRPRGINPFECLKDLFHWWPAAKITQIKQLTPVGSVTAKPKEKWSLRQFDIFRLQGKSNLVSAVAACWSNRARETEFDEDYYWMWVARVMKRSE
jgi:hypothetical protein